MKLRTFRKHITLEVRIAKKTLWLTVAGLILGLALAVALYIWLNSSVTYYPSPRPEQEPAQPKSTWRRLDPSEYNEETKKRLSVADTTGASPELIHYINHFAKEYGVSARYLVCLAREESRFDPNASGDSGKAYGVWQYHLATWQMFRRQMGLSTEDLRACEKESTRTTAWAISKGLDRHWSVASKCADEKI